MYKALVCRVSSVRPIPGADKIRLAAVGAYNVIVGLDVAEGNLVCFFEQDGQLSEEFAQVNDLVRRKDEDGKPAGGYFEPNRRVRAIKMRGVRSEGFICSLEMLAYTGYDISKLKEGDQFDALSDHPICSKYYTPATRRRMGQRGKSSRGETPMFKKHPDTEAFKRAGQMIPAGALIHISSKLHGTSGRLGHVLEEYEIKRNPFAAFFARVFKRPTTRKEWVYLNGSRNVIMEKRTGEGYYGKEAFRTNATDSIRLHKGEVIYFELVGYTETGAPIMASQSTQGLRDKEIERRFSKEIIYRYGCAPYQCDLYIYRITQVNEDGEAIDLSWHQVVCRCKELALKPVPTFETFIHDGDLEALTKKLSLLVDGVEREDEEPKAIPSRLDPTHPEEGVVIRYESEVGTGWLKHKSFVFGCLEGYLKERDDYVDLEEVA
jgi:hypothetical protein